jgi:hypothetical protein
MTDLSVNIAELFHFALIPLKHTAYQLRGRTIFEGVIVQRDKEAVNDVPFPGNRFPFSREHPTQRLLEASKLRAQRVTALSSAPKAQKPVP